MTNPAKPDLFLSRPRIQAIYEWKISEADLTFKTDSSAEDIYGEGECATMLPLFADACLHTVMSIGK